MLIVLILGVALVIHQAKQAQMAWKFSASLVVMLNVAAIVYFYNQAGVSWGWGSWLLPLTGLPQSAMIVVGSSLIIGGTFTVFYTLIRKGKLNKSEDFKRKNWIRFDVSATLIFIGILIYTSSRWAMNGIGNMRFDQIVFAMLQPLQGSDPGQIVAFIVNPFLEAVLWSASLIFVLYVFSRYQFQGHKNHPLISNGMVVPLGFLSLFIGIMLSAKVIGYADIKAYYFEHTEIYENYYVDPKEVELEFPEKKRNLVYIYLESMESSYMSTDLGGSQSNNLLPNLSQLTESGGIRFSHNGTVGGGMFQVPGANQTASSMVAQTSGLPLRPSTSFGLRDSSESNSAEYFPGAYSLGEILEKEGYNQTLLLGSKAEFAGRDQYFLQHGNYEIRDYNWAVETGRIPEDYFVWWGYEDAKLFDYAKETLTELAAKDEPFNFTMLTADTHFEDGYATEDTPDLFGDQYSNVIHASDQQVMEFLTWLQQQPYYENTTVIISGDHLTMDSDFFEELDSDYQRSVYNVFLNTDKQGAAIQERQFSAMDMFPSTLSALNVEISGDRLGLGTNLFSEQPTIIEQLGYDTFESELMKRSDFYDEQLMMNEEDTATSNSE